MNDKHLRKCKVFGFLLSPELRLNAKEQETCSGAFYFLLLQGCTGDVTALLCDAKIIYAFYTCWPTNCNKIIQIVKEQFHTSDLNDQLKSISNS